MKYREVGSDLFFLAHTFLLLNAKTIFTPLNFSYEVWNCRIA
jgi:hypothetical protein